MTQVQITTETDLASGRRTFILPGNPVPVITPMGPAPGELRVEADPSGQVSAVRAVLRPRGADVAAIADLLSRLATFPLAAGDLSGLGANDQPIVTFALDGAALSGIHGRVRQAQDLLELLNSEPILQEGARYVVDDLEIGVG